MTARLDQAAVSNLPGVLLAKDLVALAQELERRAAEIDALLEEGRQLVERAERLVCRLYAVPAELEDEIVARAAARAAARRPSDESAGADQDDA
jgi:hypothetical protein